MKKAVVAFLLVIALVATPGRSVAEANERACEEVLEHVATRLHPQMHVCPL